MKHTNFFALLVALLLWTGSLSAQEPVTVRMELDTQFYPLDPGDSLMVCGSGESLGNWQPRRHMLVPVEGRPGIYAVQIAFAPEDIGTQVSYKFVVVKPDDIQYWEEVANRSLVVPEANTTLPVTNFEYRNELGISQSVLPVIFSIDVSAWEGFEEEIEAIGIKGSAYPLPLTPRVESDPLPLEDPESDGIWTTTINLAYGSPRDLSFSLYYLQNGEWNKHQLFGKQEHVALLPEQGEEVTLALSFDPQTGNYTPASNPALLLDNYLGMYQALGDSGTGTRFQYYAAMELLKQGKAAEARSAYQQYRTDRNSSWDPRDDFDYMWMEHLGNTQGSAAVQNYAENLANTASMEFTKASYLAKAAEVAFMNGDLQTAKALSKRIYQKAKASGQMKRYGHFSRQLLAMSYLAEHPDSVVHAQSLFEEAARDSTRPRWQRQALEHQAYAYIDNEEWEQAERVQRRLTRIGTLNQRLRSHRELVDFYQRRGEHTKAEAAMEHMDTQLTELAQRNPKRYQFVWLQTQLHRARYFRNSGEEEQARAILQTALSETERPKQQRRLQRALDRLEAASATSVPTTTSDTNN